MVEMSQYRPIVITDLIVGATLVYHSLFIIHHYTLCYCIRIYINTLRAVYGTYKD